MSHEGKYLESVKRLGKKSSPAPGLVMRSEKYLKKTPEKVKKS